MENTKNSMLILNEVSQLKNYIKTLNINDTALSKSIEYYENTILTGNYTNNIFENEKVLLKIWDEFRKKWIEKVNKYTSSIYKSPIEDSLILPTSNTISYAYERDIQCDILELKAKNYRINNEKWDDEHIIFSNGMSGLTTLILCYKSILKKKQKKIKMFVWGAYFETRMFLDFVKDDTFEWRNFKHEEELFNSIKDEDFDILLIEPVRYDWDLDVIDIILLLKSILSIKNAQYRLIIFDTTLISQNLPFNQCLEVLYQIPFLTVVNFNSLLKLNQEGLELSNGGLVSIYTSKKYIKDLNAKEIAEYIKKVRTLFGAGLELREIVLLDNPFSLDNSHVKNYSDKVFFNNELLAHAVNEGSIFKKISHPSKSCKAHLQWAKAPFVIFQLHDDNMNNYLMLLAIIQHEAKKRNLELYMGSSFGFRHCRYEIIIPNINEGKGIFKVAMGYQNGKNRNMIIELFMEIANYSNINELFEKYSYLKPPTTDHIE